MENLNYEQVNTVKTEEEKFFDTSPIHAKPPKKEMSVKTKRLIFVWAMLAYPIIQWLIFFVFVNIDSIIMSFQWTKPLTNNVQFPVLTHYQEFFKQLFVNKLPQTVNAVINSFLIGVNDLILVLLSVTLAYFFYKKMPGREMFRIIFFLPSIISIVIYTVVYKYMFHSTAGPMSLLLQKIFGWKTGPDFFRDYGIIMVMIYCLWVGTGYNILILGGAIANLPEEVMESAKLDGAKMRHELFLLVIPMIWPTIAVSILGAITTMFTLFIQVDLLTSMGGGSKSPTIAYLINSKITGGENARSEAAAIGLTCTIVATPIVLLVKKFLDKASESFGF